MLHGSYNQNHQSQWSQVQTRHYRDKKSHRINPGENNIFVFCSHPTKVWVTQMSAEEKQTFSWQTNKLVYQCRPCTTGPPNCTVYYWHNSTTGNNTWKYKHATKHSWEKKRQTESWYYWTTTDKSKDLQWKRLWLNIYVSSEMPSSFCEGRFDFNSSPLLGKCEWSDFKTDITTRILFVRQETTTTVIDLKRTVRCHDLNKKEFLFDENVFVTHLFI